MTDHNNNLANRVGVSRRVFLTAAVATAATASLPAAAQTAETRKGPSDRSEYKIVTSDMVTLEKLSPAVWQVTIANPPFNLVVPEMVSALHSVVVQMGQDPHVKVIVFESGVEHYWINHFDLAQAADFPMLDTDPPQPTWTDLVLRLSKSPVISIALIRGRTRGGGNEFSLACDMRYASLEKAIFGQPEVGAGIVPGGGGTERLPRLIGRDRALEVFLSSRDYDAETAEEFGWVTRALTDNALETYVDSLTTRLAGFDKQALAAAKAQVNRAALPPDEDVYAAYREYSEALSWQGYRDRRPRMAEIVREHGLAELELQLGHFLGEAN